MRRLRLSPAQLLLALVLAAVLATSIAEALVVVPARAPSADPRPQAAKDRPVPRPRAVPGLRAAQGAVPVPRARGWRLSAPPPSSAWPAIGARAGVMVDLRTGRVLWQRGGRRALPVASLTKVMTALLVVERRAAGSRIRIPAAALRVRGSHAGLPAAGRRVAVEDLLRGLLLPSGNDAAVALAVGVAGSERAFVARMNRRARRWGMTCTRFVSVHGLGAGNRVCPRDLAHLARRAMAAPRIARIVRRRTAVARLGPGGAPLRLVSTNPLTAAGVPGVLGLKTGWAPYAGRCLITVVRRGGRRLAIVLLDAPDRVRSVRVLLAGLRGRTRR